MLNNIKINIPRISYGSILGIKNITSASRKLSAPNKYTEYEQAYQKESEYEPINDVYKFSPLGATNMPNLAGHTIEIDLGIVQGSSVRTRMFVFDIFATIRGIFGGEIKSYEIMLRESHAQAAFRMLKKAETRGADAVINIRYFASNYSNPPSIGITAYGTAVKVKPIE